ncbi:hypothetical protein D3C87_1879210 [compost metagenome]
MVAPLKFGSQHQTVISAADAAVTLNMEIPAKAMASERFRLVEKLVIDNPPNWVFPHHPEGKTNMTFGPRQEFQ